MANSAYPELPYDSWEDSKTTLHLFTQIVGKIRLALNPSANHWWHVPLYVSARGLTTSTMPYRGRNLEMEFDLLNHVLRLRDSRGLDGRISLENNSVASFCRNVMDELRMNDVEVDISLLPFDPAKTGSEIPYLKDDKHSSYDVEYVSRFFQILTRIESVFKLFRGRFVGKCSPVHFFWHSFDLAVTRFSGRPAKIAEDADPVTREAYSHEVISAGFWPGDGTFPEPAFYAYAHPEPESLSESPLRPDAAWWQNVGETHLALYRYDDFRKASRPEKELLDFLQSSYEAAADLAAWPRKELELTT